MTVFHHIAAIGQLERLVGVLLDQEDGYAISAQLFDDVEDLLNDDRRQSQRRLVKQQQLGLAHQCTGNGEHLLFAAGHGAATLLETLLQSWEQQQHLVQLLLEVRLVGEEPTHGQVLLDRQPSKDAPPFGYHGNVLAHDVEGLLADQLLALEADAAFGRHGRSAERHQQGRLAGAVGADQGDDLALADFHVDVMQRLDLAVKGRDVFEIQHGYASPR